jgi:hypothetical protein
MHKKHEEEEEEEDGRLLPGEGARDGGSLTLPSQVCRAKWRRRQSSRVESVACAAEAVACRSAANSFGGNHVYCPTTGCLEPKTNKQTNKRQCTRKVSNTTHNPILQRCRKQRIPGWIYSLMTWMACLGVAFQFPFPSSSSVPFD